MQGILNGSEANSGIDAIFIRGECARVFVFKQKIMITCFGSLKYRIQSSYLHTQASSQRECGQNEGSLGRESNTSEVI